MSTRATASPGTLSSRPPSGYAALLAAEGLGCWSKTTHGKSLHVMVPIAPEMDWDRALACTRIVTECLAEIDPDRYVTSAGLEARPGPLFIDYMRNGRVTNAVGDLSPRATGFSGRRSLQLAKDGRRASVGRVQPSKPALLEDFVGTISFVMAQLVAFAAWIVVNAGKVPQLAPFDPFPYRLLSSITSLEAVLLAAFVLMEQNRMGMVADRRDISICRSICWPSNERPRLYKCSTGSARDWASISIKTRSAASWDGMSRWNTFEELHSPLPDAQDR
jgi:Protein of unknown function (DUF1003)/LigD, primase-polymerase domain